MITHLALLSGGLASRLQPICRHIPKSLVDINGDHFIEHQFALLKEQGITDVVLCVGYLGKKIEEYVGDGNRFGINVKYSYDGEKLLGTAGAIKKALHLLPDAFFVMYGDSYPLIDFKAVSDQFELNDKLTMMTITENHDERYVNNVIFDNGVIVTYDKQKPSIEMRHIDYGLSIMRQSCFSSLGVDEFYDLADMQKDLSCKGQLSGYEADEGTHEIGSFWGIAEFTKYIRPSSLINLKT